LRRAKDGAQAFGNQILDLYLKCTLSFFFRLPGDSVVSMREEQLRELIAQVKTGVLSCRAFIAKMAWLGFTAPMASQLLYASGVSSG
jgi:hypothetical protein